MEDTLQWPKVKKTNNDLQYNAEKVKDWDTELH
jgi:hypothetical protein